MSANSLLGLIAGAAVAPCAGEAAVADGRAGRWPVVAAVGLLIAGAAAPLAAAAVALAGRLPEPPLAASALLALLVLAPAGAGLAAAVGGWRPIAGPLGEPDAEHAILRVFLATLLFATALGLTAWNPGAGAPPLGVPVAALALVAAWAMLLRVMLRPATAPWWRWSASLGDIVLVSVLLHVGGAAFAGWFPLYLLAGFYGGRRFGTDALAVTALAGVAGFAIVATTTAFWREHLSLAIGLMASLVVLPAFVGRAMHRIAGDQRAAAAAAAEWQRLLLLIGDTLQGEYPAVRIDDILDLAAAESGRFAAPVERFDLRSLVAAALAAPRAEAEASGIRLHWCIDPRLPRRLRGRGRALARIVGALVGHALANPTAPAVNLMLDRIGDDEGRGICLRLRVVGADWREADAGDDRPAIVLRLAQRLLAAMAGELAIEDAEGSAGVPVATMMLAGDSDEAAALPDLQGNPVFVATDDGGFVEDLAALLASCDVAPEWIGDLDAPVAQFAGGISGTRAVLLVDGRRRPVQALVLAQQAAQSGADAPFVVLVAEAAIFRQLAERNDLELDGLVPAPVTGDLLANLLAALPLANNPVVAPPPTADGYGAAVNRITPITAHPRFAPEVAAVDRQTLEALRALDGSGGFLREVIESFQADAHRIMRELVAAAAAADATGFASGLAALRRAASQLGGRQLSELAASLQGLTAGELRRHGAAEVGRLAAEADRLSTVLIANLPQREAVQP